MESAEAVRLRAGAEQLGCTLSQAQAEHLIAYLSLLAKWNRVYNLTAVRDPAEMMTQHLLDSLSIVPPLRRHLSNRPVGSLARVLDVGSGGGLPGVVLAVVMPQLDVTCVDTVIKKVSFIRQVALELGLPNLHAVHARVEEMTAPSFDVVVSRAFASLSDFVGLTHQHLAPGAVWLAMKGKRPDDEMAALPSGIDVFHVEHLAVPGLAAERCAVWIQPSTQAQVNP
jgi:16S rRNA (guanine527-N7)-methyltransferase